MDSHELSRTDRSAEIDALETRLSTLEQTLKNVTQLLDVRTKANDRSAEGYRITGENNRIVLVEDGIERNLGEYEKIEGLDLIIKGNNNNLKFELPIKFHSAIIEIVANSAEVYIGSSTHFCWHVRCLFGNNQRFHWGKGSRTTGLCVAWLQRENAAALIGENCLFAPETSVWGFDGHLIYDKQTNKVLNEVRGPVIIGDHCWIGASARLLKNTHLPANTVVGGGSVVTRAFTEEYTVIAGSPAKVIRTNCGWR